MASKARACVYRRVSSASQGRGEGWSLESQEARAAEYCKDMGLTVVKVFEEVASASKAGRPRFAEMVAYLRAHPGVVLIVEKMDRLARNSRDEATLDELVDEGLYIHFIRDQKVLHAGAEPGERLLEDINAALAKHYSRNLAKEIKKGHDARFEAGYFPMGCPPYGYVYPPRRARERVNIIPDPEAARIVRKLFEAYVAGEGKSLAQLVELAHQLGYRPFRGLRMSTTGARNLLMNPTYAGWIRHKGEIRRGNHEPIISQALWDAAEKRRAERPRKSKPNRRPEQLLHAFSGVFSCGGCGGTMYRYQRSGPGSQVRWICARRCDKAAYVPEGVLSELVTEALQELEFPEGFFDSFTKSMKNDKVPRKASVAEQRTIIRREEKVREDLLDWLSAGDITREQYRDRRAKSEQREQAAREELARLESPGRESPADILARYVGLAGEFVELFAAGNPQNKRKILGLVWETSTAVGRTTVDAQRRRIKPRWRPVWAALLAARRGLTGSTRQKIVNVLRSQASVEQAG